LTGGQPNHTRSPARIKNKDSKGDNGDVHNGRVKPQMPKRQKKGGRGGKKKKGQRPVPNFRYKLQKREGG